MLNKTLTPVPVLTTKRLTLRQLVASDEQAIFDLRSNADVNKFLDRKIARTLDDARQFIKTVNENIANNVSIYWGITLNDINELVGTICLFGFADDDRKCEIGYELLTQFQRQGIMQEAIGEVIDYAFNAISVQEIEAVFHRDNRSSAKLLEKRSFRNSNKVDKTNLALICYHLKNEHDNPKQKIQRENH